MAKEQLKTFTTPVAGLVEPYAWLNKADTKFNERGEHKVNLTFDLSDPKVRKMIDVLQKIHDDAYAKHSQTTRRTLAGSAWQEAY
ncbi:ssDNA-binding protein [Enterobacter phage 01_vB_Eclo_IJM]|nr:ssDNA-binding protein [Enterobacter phage 01_vB_Eclo_IJM]